MRLTAIVFVLVCSFAVFGQSIHRGTTKLPQTTKPIDERIEEARLLLTAGKVSEAIAAYSEVVRIAPKAPMALLGLAVAEYQAKRYLESVGHADAAVHLSPELTAAYLFTGGGYLEMGEAPRAVEPLRKAVAGMPGDRNATRMLAEALYGSGQYEEALSYFRRSADLEPSSSRVWYGLAQEYDALAAKAVAAIQRANPEGAAAYAVSGDLYLRQGRFESAFAAFRRAVRLDPSLPAVHIGIALVYRATGHENWVVEEEQFEPKSAELSSDDPYRIYLSERQQAAEAYTRLDQLPPSSEQHVHRAKSFDDAGDYAGAAAEWREALALNPGNPQTQLGLSWSLFRRRDYEAALPVITALLKVNPQWVEANFLYGAALLNMEQPDRAIPFLQKAATRDATFLPAQAAYGQALLRVGRAAEAIPHLLTGLPADQDGAIRFQLVRAYQLTARRELAAAAIAEYREFRKKNEEALNRNEDTRITAPDRGSH